MQLEHWKKAWEANNIGFHKRKPHKLLLTHYSSLNLKAGSRIFLPLCGKTLDIAWLMSLGHHVVGVEISELAIQQLFQELEIKPNITQTGSLIHYRAPHIDIFVSDIFDLKQGHVGEIHAIYDRAALVALPEDIRTRYAQQVTELSNRAPQLLITFDYDQHLKQGPPFSVPETEITRLYKHDYTFELLERIVVPGGIGGSVEASEDIWLLT